MKDDNIEKTFYHLTEDENKRVEQQKKQIKKLKTKEIDKAIKEWGKDGSSFQVWACSRCSHKCNPIKVINFKDPRKGKKFLFGFCYLGKETLKIRRGKNLNCYGFLFPQKIEEKEE
jgi:hypothetical protein